MLAQCLNLKGFGAKMVEASSKSGGKCPVCKAATETKWRPFCSKRCADVDLGRWVTGGYAIATDEAPSSGEDSGAE